MIEPELLSVYVDPLKTTLLFFVASAALALLAAVTLFALARSSSVFVRRVTELVIETSRSVPTVVFVVMIGNIGITHGFAFLDSVPIIGVSNGFSAAAMFVVLALAFSSSGHLCRIIEAGVSSLPHPCRAQARILPLTRLARAKIVFVECAPALIPPVSNRLVHHLHNTAFISLLPITGVFATMRGEIAETALAVEHIVVAAGIFIVLSAGIGLCGTLLLKAVLPARGRVRAGRARAGRIVTASRQP